MWKVPLLTAQNILREYGQLLDDYKDLKKAFDARPANSVAKTTPVTTAATKSEQPPRNPYVLVLVDGNGYIVSHRSPAL